MRMFEKLPRRSISDGSSSRTRATHYTHTTSDTCRQIPSGRAQWRPRTEGVADERVVPNGTRRPSAISRPHTAAARSTMASKETRRRGTVRRCRGAPWRPRSAAEASTAEANSATSGTSGPSPPGDTCGHTKKHACGEPKPWCGANDCRDASACAMRMGLRLASITDRLVPAAALGS